MEAGTVKAKSFSKDGLQTSETISAAFDVAPVNWKVVSANSQLKDFSAKNAIDSDPSTLWRTDPKDDFPYHIIIDLGEHMTLKGFTYTPAKQKNRGGIIFKYNFYVSQDGKNWQKVIQGKTFSNIKNNPIKQEVDFDMVYKAKYIKFEGLNSVNDEESSASAAEIGVITN